jgi:protein TonB
MERLLPALIITLLLHGLFLGMNLGSFGQVRPLPVPDRRVVTMTLFEREQPVVPDPPTRKSNPMKPRKPVAPVPKRKELKVKKPAVPPIKEESISSAAETLPEKATAAEQRSMTEALPLMDVVPAAPLTAAVAPSVSNTVFEAEPLYARNPTPAYPAMARRRGYQGTVLLNVLVAADGTVQVVTMGQSSGYPMLDQAAEKSVVAWAFKPGTRGGRAVEMWVRVPVRFALQ